MARGFRTINLRVYDGDEVELAKKGVHLRMTGYVPVPSIGLYEYLLVFEDDENSDEGILGSRPAAEHSG